MTKLLPALLLGLIAHTASATVIHDESSDGDLSGVFGAPDSLPISTGDNTVVGDIGNNGNTGSSNGGIRDADYFTFNVPAGKALTNITLDSYTNSGSGVQSFIGYVDAATFTGQGSGDLANAAAFELFGFSDLANPNLLTAITGLAGPLGPGAHSFWVQETAAQMVDYSFTFTVVPEPVSAGLGLLGLALVAGRRRR